MKSDAINLKADINHTHSGYALTSHNHSASDITSGTFSTSKLPVSSSQVNSTSYIPTSSLVYSMNSTLSNHESRIQELEAGGGGGYIELSTSYSWLKVYVPNESTGVVGKIVINASDTTTVNISYMKQIFTATSTEAYGFKTGEYTAGSKSCPVVGKSYSRTVEVMTQSYTSARSIFISLRINNEDPYNVYLYPLNGTYAFSVTR